MIILVGVRGKLDIIYFAIPVHYESNDTLNEINAPPGHGHN